VRPYAAIALGAFVLSLGPHASAWGHPVPFEAPYGWLLHVVPGLSGIRAVARLAVVVAMAVAVLAGFGATWLLNRAPSRWRIALTAALIVGAMAEGWAAPLPLVRFDPVDDGDRDAYEYVRHLPAGGVLELPISTASYAREARYQYLTLLHGHRIVNGYSGYISPLTAFLGGAQSPLNEADRASDVMAAVRTAGVRFLVIHRAWMEDRQVLAAWDRTLATDAGQLFSALTFGDTTVAALAPIGVPAPEKTGAAVPPASIHATASHSVDRIPLMFDGDFDTRWVSGGPQQGDEWIALDFDRPRDIAAVGLRMAERSWSDYPRDLAVDSINDRQAVGLVRGSVLPALTQAILADGKYPLIRIQLPPNRTSTLRLRQMGTTRRLFWSIHELEVWER